MIDLDKEVPSYVRRKPTDFPLDIGGFAGGIYFHDEDYIWRLYIKGRNSCEFAIYNLPDFKLHLANITGGVEAINEISRAVIANVDLIKSAYISRSSQVDSTTTYCWG